ncbi:MAG TPA: DEAD/DEAH box helicase [Tepidisphaeraceae bacterium]
MLFADLHLSPPILQALRATGYSSATPIQAQAIPHVLEGKDVLGCAQTGTGKTAAFALPILHRLSIKQPTGVMVRKPRCLVLCPTRELASQIAESFATYGKQLHLRQTVIFGGVSEHRQIAALKQGVDIIVATPGRLMDLMGQRHVDLSAVETVVLDEADRMLDMGFIQPIRRIVSQLPRNRQTLLFSATMAPEIRQLADSLLHHPAVVQTAPVSTTAAKIEESVYRVEKRDKSALLAHLVQTLPMYRTLVFTRTKHGADKLVRDLHTRGIRAEAIHGNKSQNARQRALANFVADKIPVLVATDIASRGIDVDGITHVVNYDLTHEPETYVHRIGRTARAGASGSAVSFCDKEEVSNLKAIERLIRRSIPSANNPLPAGNHQPQTQNRPHAHQPTQQRAAQHPHQPRHAAPKSHAQQRDAKSHSQHPRHPLARHSNARSAHKVGAGGHSAHRSGGGRKQSHRHR